MDNISKQDTGFSITYFYIIDFKEVFHKRHKAGHLLYNSRILTIN